MIVAVFIRESVKFLGNRIKKKMFVINKEEWKDIINLWPLNRYGAKQQKTCSINNSGRKGILQRAHYNKS